MKRRNLTIALVTAALAGAVWLGRAAWRSPHQLVTLRVRAVPLAEVLRRLEHLTGEKIGADKTVTARVSIDVKNQPLAEVLDQVAEQAGARWRRTFAVYELDSARRALEGVLEGGGDLAAVGWTNLAPSVATATPSSGIGGAGRIVTLASGGESRSGTGTFKSKADLDAFLNDQANGAEPAGGGAEASGSRGGPVMRRMTVRVGPDGSTTTALNEGGKVKVTRVRPDGTKEELPAEQEPELAGQAGQAGSGQSDSDRPVRHMVRMSPDGTVLEDWSSQRLVMEDRLIDRLGDAAPARATLETATRTADRVRGRLATYYTLEPSPEAGEGAGMSLSRQGSYSGGTNGDLDLGEVRRRIEQEGKQRRLKELSQSPEQQVQQARRRRVPNAGSGTSTSVEETH